MMHWVVTHLNYFFAHHGYWAVLWEFFRRAPGFPCQAKSFLILASAFLRERNIGSALPVSRLWVP